MSGGYNVLILWYGERQVFHFLICDEWDGGTDTDVGRRLGQCEEDWLGRAIFNLKETAIFTPQPLQVNILQTLKYHWNDSDELCRKVFTKYISYFNLLGNFGHHPNMVNHLLIWMIDLNTSKCFFIGITFVEKIFNNCTKLYRKKRDSQFFIVTQWRTVEFARECKRICCVRWLSFYLWANSKVTFLLCILLNLQRLGWEGSAGLKI